MLSDLTVRQRLELIRYFNALTQPAFEQLIFALAVPRGLVPSNVSAQGNRAVALLEWVHGPTGCGMEELLRVLSQIAPLPSDLMPVLTSSPVQPVIPQVRVGKSLDNPDLISIQPKEHIEVSLPNGVTLEMVNIPAGEFFMGSPENEEGRYDSEGPLHRVQVQAFHMGKYLVTQEQWYAISLMDYVDSDLAPSPSAFRGARHPVEGVSWLEVIEFCKRLSNYTGQHYRLPSEAEWEYACRAGTITPYSFGDTLTDQQANFRNPKGTTPVSNYPSNAFNLYDMHGNVWEWCVDGWHTNYNNAPMDGRAWSDEDGDDSFEKVIRGGSWSDVPRYCRSACRNPIKRDNRSDGLGFRVVFKPKIR